MRAAALLIGLLLLTAGCLGFGGEDAEEEDPADENDAETEPSDDSQQDASDEEEQDHGHDPAPEAHWDNRTGEVTGTNVVVQSDGSTEETMDVPEGATSFEINLTAESGEIDALLYPPGCEEEDCAEGLSTHESQEESVQPNGGTVTWSTSSPDNGTWTLSMAKADAGMSAVPYAVSFMYVDVHEPAPGHHSA